MFVLFASAFSQLHGGIIRLHYYYTYKKINKSSYKFFRRVWVETISMKQDNDISTYISEKQALMKKDREQTIVITSQKRNTQSASKSY